MTDVISPFLDSAYQPNAHVFAFDDFVSSSLALFPSQVFTNESTSSKLSKEATTQGSTSRWFNGNDGSTFFIIKTAWP